MPNDHCPRAGEVQEISARIVVAEQAQSALSGLLLELDHANLPMAAIHVNAALEQIRLDLVILKSSSC